MLRIPYLGMIVTCLLYFYLKAGQTLASTPIIQDFRGQKHLFNDSIVHLSSPWAVIPDRFIDPLDEKAWTDASLVSLPGTWQSLYTDAIKILSLKTVYL
ncbi:MAG: hypothetical protein ACOH5I_02480 [Oligoflexus sp.]